MKTTLTKSVLVLSLILSVAESKGNNNQGRNYANNNYTQQNYQVESTPSNVADALSSTKSQLTQELQDSITYMYNEEKLAKEVYLNIYEKQSLQQLYNIATKSEVKHEEAVNNLAIKYDLNITQYPDTDIPYDKNSIDKYGSGQYAVEAIQELYDMLYNKGINSQQDALEVGCMVEVTDIDDLDKYIIQASASNASDVLEVFNFLRDGSYIHYWAFDNGLKNIGISTGCCSLGDTYCHPEYPQDNQTQTTNQDKVDSPTALEVSKIYVATFNRAPDSDGLNYWTNNSNLTISEISQSFFDQNETKNIYPDTISNRDFIKSTYNNLFNREPDTAGLDYWEKDLNSETYSKNLFIETLINGATGDDTTILQNKASAGIYFANANINDTDLAYSIMKEITADTSSLISVQNKISEYNE